jgi:hypothetical protein
MSAGPHSELRIVDEFWAQLRSVDERAAARARAHEARRQLVRTLAIAVIALLAAAAVALAAKALLTGTAAPRRFAGQSLYFGAVKPGTTHLLNVREPDPGGGPPWGVRIFKTTQAGRVCAQVGRVVSGHLAALGVAGDFQNDGRAHRLPVEAPGCSSLTTSGHLALIVLAQPVPTASGLPVDPAAANSGCLTPESRRLVQAQPERLRRYIRAMQARGNRQEELLARRHLRQALMRLRHLPHPCRANDLRTVISGFAGPRALSVTLTMNGHALRHSVHPAEEGAFLYVLSGRPPLPIDGLTIGYEDGLECPAPNPLQAARRSPGSAACLRHKG